MKLSFAEVFGHPPEAVASAPGRVNLLGEHTDYNDGLVLPLALHQRTTVSLSRAEGPECVLRSGLLGQTVRFSPRTSPDELFARYVYGCLREADIGPVPVPALNILVESDVPMGVGLSSSAALEVATLRALDVLRGARTDPMALAQRAQRAEMLHAGVQCGIMDQMAASLGGETYALFLDTRSLETRRVPLPAHTSVLVLDCGVARALAATPFNQRRRECAEACAMLGVTSLRDAVDLRAIDALSDPWRARARHVTHENARVLRAIDSASASELGELMNESHASLRDDYQVSIPPLDELVSLLQAHPAVYGARLTGAGFGGACIALCATADIGAVSASVLADFRGAGGEGRELARCLA